MAKVVIIYVGDQRRSKDAPSWSSFWLKELPGATNPAPDSCSIIICYTDLNKEDTLLVNVHIREEF